MCPVTQAKEERRFLNIFEQFGCCWGSTRGYPITQSRRFFFRYHVFTQWEKNLGFHAILQNLGWKLVNSRNHAKMLCFSRITQIFIRFHAFTQEKRPITQSCKLMKWASLLFSRSIMKIFNPAKSNQHFSQDTPSFQYFSFFVEDQRLKHTKTKYSTPNSCHTVSASKFKKGTIKSLKMNSMRTVTYRN